MKLVILISALLILSCQAKPSKEAKANICGYESCPKTDPNALNVHLVPHSHDDVGWNKNVDKYYYDDVESIISSVITALKQNEERRFVQVETAFFKKWWESQTEERRQDTIDLISSGRLEIINGAWSMNDEAAVNYQSTIDQFSLGLRYLEERLGECSRPRIGWQIDPFGHSREQASIFAQMGFDGVFFARIDYRDRSRRRNIKSMEHIWQGSQNIEDSDIFTGVLYSHYSAPGGFSWDHSNNDAPIIEDEDSFDFNYPQRVEEFTARVNDVADKYLTNNIMMTMGDDFNYRAAQEYFLNMDKLIQGFKLYPQKDNQNRTINVIYSTPSCYTKAINEYVLANKIELQRKTDDFFPYADSPHRYWTGYFTSRPTSKRNERQSNNLLQITKQLGAATMKTVKEEGVNALGEAVGVMQHHDAITGTEKQNVKDSYQRLLSAANKKAQTFSSAAITELLGSKGTDTLDLHTCYLGNVSDCAQSGSKDKFYIVLYNPLAQSTNYYVNVPVSGDAWGVVNPDGEIVPSDVFDAIKDFGTAQKNVLIFKAEVPAAGVAVYTVAKSSGNGNKVQTVQVGDDDPIGYFDTNIKVDSTSGLLKSVTMHGTTLDVSQELLYYLSKNDGDGNSGAYLFRPDGEAKKISDKATFTVTKGTEVTEVKQVFGEWGTQIIRIFKDEPDYIEFDWLVGPIDISDGIGKEVISRFTTSIKSSGKFYTDSNGRELLERTRDARADYTYSNEEPITGNYYPVTSGILINDTNLDIEFAVLNDRAQGGSSLKDGQVEIMVHRRCTHDDGKGVGENLDEKDGDGIGILVRGQHYVTLGKKVLGDKSLAAIRRRIALEKLDAPWQFVSDQDLDTIVSNKKISLLSKELPENVHLLTTELLSVDGSTGKLLLRLEHILEQNEDVNLSKDVTVDVKDLFTSFTITDLQETLLAGDRLKSESQRLVWDVTKKEQNKPKALEGTSVTLGTMQIRTFIADIQFTNSKYAIFQTLKNKFNKFGKFLSNIF